MPLLELDNGERLSEGPAIVQYVADLAPDKNLVPARQHGALPPIEWLNFIGTELHKGFGALFNPALPDEAKAMAKQPTRPPPGLGRTSSWKASST